MGDVISLAGRSLKDSSNHKFSQKDTSSVVIVADFAQTGAEFESEDEEGEIEDNEELKRFDALSKRDQFIVIMRELDDAIASADNSSEAAGREKIALWMAIEVATDLLGVDSDSLLVSEVKS